MLKEGGKVCTVTDFEEIIRRRRPLSNYFPETVEIELQRYPRISDLRAMMVSAGFTDLQEAAAEREYELQDIQKYRDKAFSSWHPDLTGSLCVWHPAPGAGCAGAPHLAISLYLLLWGVKGLRWRFKPMLLQPSSTPGRCCALHLWRYTTG